MLGVIILCKIRIYKSFFRVLLHFHSQEFLNLKWENKLQLSFFLIAGIQVYFYRLIREKKGCAWKTITWFSNEPGWKQFAFPLVLRYYVLWLVKKVCGQIVFLRLTLASYINFEFWLVSWIVCACCEWPEWKLRFWFHDTHWKPLGTIFIAWKGGGGAFWATHSGI